MSTTPRVPSPQQIALWRSRRVGQKVMLISTTDEWTKLTAGAIGTVDLIDDTGTHHCKWSDGSTLGLVPGVDVFTVEEKAPTLSMRVPKIGTTITGATVEEIVRLFEATRDAGRYGASQIGSMWKVRDESDPKRKVVAQVSYNGRIWPATGRPE